MDSSLFFSVPENRSRGYWRCDRREDPADILSVYITAQDAGAGINFALVASDSPRRWSLVLRAGSLDFENLENHTIHLSLSDGHVTTTSSVVVRVIDVNDVTVTSVEALTGSGMLSTAGGERFSVLGSNFGSLHSDLSAVRVILGDKEASSCNIGYDLDSENGALTNSIADCL